MADLTAANEAKAEAAFGAAFNDAPPVVETPPAKVVEEVVTDPVTPAAVAPAPVVEKPQYVRLTKQDWDNAKANLGKVSTLESRLAKFEGSVPKTEQIVQQAIEAIRSQTPAGGKVTVTAEDFAELGENFEEVSGMTMKGLQRVLDRFNVTGTAPAPAPVDVDAAVEKVLLVREEKILTKTYPDWSTIVGRPPVPGAPIDQANPFRQWLAKQPAEYQKEISETDSPADIQDAITKYKASQTAAPAPRTDKAAARRAVIEDAITPRADGNPPPLNPPQSADDAFAAGFKAVRH